MYSVCNSPQLQNWFGNVIIDIKAAVAPWHFHFNSSALNQQQSGFWRCCDFLMYHCTHDAKAFWSWWGKMDCNLCQWWQLPWCYRAQAAHWKSQPVDLAATWTPGSPGRETGPRSIIQVRIPGTAKLNLNDLRLKSWSWNHHNDVEVHASGWFVTQSQSSSQWATSGRFGHVIIE
jgi:hypothetical protein